MHKEVITLEPLTEEAFAPFGHIIEFDKTDDDTYEVRNNGSAVRYRDFSQAGYGVDDDSGIGIFKVLPLSTSNKVPMLERHPLGKQSMIPLRGQALVVVVAPPGDKPQPENMKAFITDGHEGITYHTGVWHSPLRTLVKRNDDYVLVIDHKGGKDNCDIFHFDDNTDIELLYPLWL